MSILKKEISIKELKGNFIKMISDDWALLTAGSEDSYNMMTVSWGGIGELWGKEVCFVFVRPQRYTYNFMEKNSRFSLSFFDGDYKKELAVCGSQSGRDVDKAALTGLEAQPMGGALGYNQAKTVLVLKKLAYQDIDPKGFVDDSVMENYKAADFHRVYIGEIEKVLVEE